MDMAINRPTLSSLDSFIDSNFYKWMQKLQQFKSSIYGFYITFIILESAEYSRCDKILTVIAR
jgi:hypothetical protein